MDIRTDVQKQPHDVFLSHNTKDKKQVLIIANHLESQGLKPWIDISRIRGGDSLPKEIKNAIYSSRVAAVCVGRYGLGTWQQDELETITTRQIKGNLRLIPILLPGVDELPDEPDYCSLEKLLYFSFSSSSFASSEDVFELNKLAGEIKQDLHEWRLSKLENLIREREEAVQKLEKISQEIDEIEAQLKTKLSQDRQRGFEWLVSKRNGIVIERYVRKALRNFRILENTLVEMEDGIQRFCSDIDTCLKFASRAIQTEQPSRIEMMGIQLFLAKSEFDTPEFYEGEITTQAYQKVFSLIEADLSEDLDEAVKQELRTCFVFLENRISVLI